jgi:hypothetical protein
MAELARFSPCQCYRYWLERRLGPGRCVAVIMINPSMADATRDDRTIRRVIGFGRCERWGRIVVVNLFALIASRVTALAEAEDPVGPDNARHIAVAVAEADLCVAAWGAAAKLPLRLRDEWRRTERLAQAAGKPLHCWGMTRCGHPRHPLYLPRDSALRPWNPPP